MPHPHETAGADPNFMLSLARGLSVLRAFTKGESSLSVTEAARLSGLSRAVVRRCLYTLTKLGYATRADGGYELTPQVLTLGFAYLRSAPLAGYAQPVLERVSGQLHEACSLSVLDQADIVYVARAATQRILSIGLFVGSRLPAYCTSMGRVLLAGMPSAELSGYLDKVTLVPHTKHTIVSRTALLTELRRVRNNGYALVDQELELGLRSIAVPVRKPDGTVVAAINSGVQTSRVDRRAMVRDFLPVIQSAAEEIAFALGHGVR